MELDINLDARQVLFHLNYMGYRNISREQLKNFMIDLKKLIRYESNSQVMVHAGPASINIQRLFEAHTKTSELKKRAKHPDEKEEKTKPNGNIKNKLVKAKSATEIPAQTDKQDAAKCGKILKKTASADKENIPVSNENQRQQHNEPPKSKMWIRPKSAHKAMTNRKTDPVSLYQEYQKNWAKFKSNICETPRSELRWKIREKMLSNH